MPTTIEYVPAGAPRRRPGIRFRIIASFSLLTLLCVAMAYVTASAQEPGCFSWGTCWPGHPKEPNLIWFFLALWPGGIAAGTAFLSFLFTGRPW